MKKILSIVLFIALGTHFTTAQNADVISQLSNTEVVRHTSGGDTLGIVSTLGEPFGGFYEQNGIVISFEPFLFFFPQGPSATKELPVIADLIVFPNPTTDDAILKRENTSQPYTIHLYETKGTQLSEWTWDAGMETFQISLNQYAPATYFLMVTDEKLTKASQFKVIIR